MKLISRTKTIKAEASEDTSNWDGGVRGGGGAVISLHTCRLQPIILRPYLILR